MNAIEALKDIRVTLTESEESILKTKYEEILTGTDAESLMAQLGEIDNLLANMVAEVTAKCAESIDTEASTSNKLVLCRISQIAIILLRQIEEGEQPNTSDE